MDILNFFQRLLRQKSKAEPVQSLESGFESDLNQSIGSIKYSIGANNTDFAEIPKTSPSIELQKDSLQLGVAAGYTGRALKEIESSLIRIESQMASKDWFTSQFEDRTPELIEAFKKHDENTQKRFDSIERLTGLMQRTAEKSPEPIKTELFGQIEAVKAELSPSIKMQKLISIVRESKEISYTDLAARLEISESALRGLLSNTIKRSGAVERFRKDGKGWVRLVI